MSLPIYLNFKFATIPIPPNDNINISEFENFKNASASEFEKVLSDIEEITKKYSLPDDIKEKPTGILIAITSASKFSGCYTMDYINNIKEDEIRHTLVGWNHLAEFVIHKDNSNKWNAYRNMS